MAMTSVVSPSKPAQVWPLRWKRLVTLSVIG